MSATPPAAERPMLGLLVTHGRLGRSLIETAEQILGPQERIAFLSNEDCSSVALREEIEQMLAEMLADGERAVVFVDLLAGSCGGVCRALAGHRDRLLLIGGANLPMLLEFLYHRGRAGPRELRSRIEQRGRDAIASIGWPEET